MRITPTLIGVIAAGNRSRNDPYFPDCIVLMHYDNNYTDVKGNSFTNTGTTFSTNAKWGSHSMSVNGTAPGGGGSNVLFCAANSVLDITSSGNFTIECWAYLNSDCATGQYYAFTRLASSLGATEITFGCKPTVNGPNCLFAFTQIGLGNLGESNSTVNVPTGQWVHVALVRSGNNFYLFQDGTQVVSWTRTYYPPAGNKALQVGSVGAFALDGRMDDLRITKFARYTSNFTPPAAAFPDS